MTDVAIEAERLKARVRLIEDLFLFAMANLAILDHAGDLNEDWQNVLWWCPFCGESSTGKPCDLKHAADCPYGYADAHFIDICRHRAPVIAALVAEKGKEPDNDH